MHFFLLFLSLSHILARLSDCILGFKKLFEEELKQVQTNESSKPTTSINQKLHALYR